MSNFVDRLMFWDNQLTFVPSFGFKKEPYLITGAQKIRTESVGMSGIFIEESGGIRSRLKGDNELVDFRNSFVASFRTDEILEHCVSMLFEVRYCAGDLFCYSRLHIYQNKNKHKLITLWISLKNIFIIDEDLIVTGWLEI